MTGKRRQWAPPIAKRRAKSAQTRKSDGHNRSRRLSEPVFAGLQMMEGLAVPEAPERKTIMIDATYLKAHRTASSLRVKKGAQAA